MFEEIEIPGQAQGRLMLLVVDVRGDGCCKEQGRFRKRPYEYFFSYTHKFVGAVREPPFFLVQLINVIWSLYQLR